MSSRAFKTALVATAALFAVIIGLQALPGLLVDYWWFRALDHGPVFTRMLFTKFWLWCLGFVVAFFGAATGLILALRRTGDQEAMFYRWGRWTIRLPSVRRFAGIFGWVVAVLAGLVGGGSAAALWHRVLLLLNRVPFEAQDPIFHNNVGFYVFVFPVVTLLVPLFQVLAWVSLGLAGLVYFASGAFAVERVEDFPARPFRHMAGTVGVIFLLTAGAYFLQRYDLLYSRTGVVFGAGHTDVKVRLIGYWVMTAASVVAAAVFFSARAVKDYKRLIGAVAGWAALAVVCLVLLPPAVQSLRVEPNELELERPYLENAISQTLNAYGLREVAGVPYSVREDVSYADLQAEQDTISNIRVWDKGPLSEIYRQKQGLRAYYDFPGIAVDRYLLGGSVVQMMLSPRELRWELLPDQAQTWVNLRLQYTHGYGVCASPVNERTEEGFPVLLVRDIPPVAPEGMELGRPQVYYGQFTRDYVFVNTRAEEFDYPKGAENRYTRYDGRGGVEASGFVAKLMFALHFADMKVILSDDLVEGSRLMYRRTIGERVQHLAPYLTMDSDPYAVIHDGRVYWIQDAYTTSRHYPYSEPAQGGDFNYIRNSVKAVVDAYHGSVNLYVADPDDPLIQAYQSIFPGLYSPLSEMPDGLRRHIRYPRDLFDIQADKYRKYHMQDPRVFYNQEDLWEVPMEFYRGRHRPVRSYFITMRLPDGERAEFILMLPFTPQGKDNMIAWLAARCDGEHYGELTAFIFPKGKVVYGPKQVEARIDQDPDISQQLTLWSQRGSEVIRGNLLVIPVAGGILYVEPLYIQAETGAVPQLRRIITADGERVSMRPTLSESLAGLFEGVAPTAPPEQPAKPTVPAAVPEARELHRQVQERYNAAQKAQRAGDWAEYGRQMEQMEEVLDELGKLLEATRAAPPG
ncbi:MAG: UPF0182 family protein [Candidatus Brocadiia bacterium]